MTNLHEALDDLDATAGLAKAGGAKPPGSGWEMIPKGKRGGFRRKTGSGWEYWYPGLFGGKTSRTPHEKEGHGVHAVHHAAMEAHHEDRQTAIAAGMHEQYRRQYGAPLPLHLARYHPLAHELGRHYEAARKHGNAADQHRQAERHSDVPKGDKYREEANTARAMGRSAQRESDEAHRESDEAHKGVIPATDLQKSDIAKALDDLEAAAGLRKADGPAKPPKEYRESGATERGDYASRGDYKYPIDTAKHVRAAIGYFSKPKNAAVYSGAEQNAIWKRIAAAARKFGIEMGEESGPPSVQKSDTVAVPLIKHLDEARSSPLDWLDNFMDTPLGAAAGDVVKRHCALLAAKARRDAEQPSWQARQAMDPVARAQCEAENEQADAAANRERHEIEAQMHELEAQLVDLCCEAAKGSYDANLAKAIAEGEIVPGAPDGELFKADGAKPPGSGWEPIPHGHHGGFRSRTGARGRSAYVYWYPGDQQPYSSPYAAPRRVPQATESQRVLDEHVATTVNAIQSAAEHSASAAFERDADEASRHTEHLQHIYSGAVTGLDGVRSQQVRAARDTALGWLTAVRHHMATGQGTTPTTPWKRHE